MLRVILGAIIGFIVWSILWVGSDAVFSAISPGWYGKHHAELEQAVNNKTPFMSDSTILLIGLVRSVIFSIISGFIAALIAKENTKSTLALGVLLLLFGIFIQSIFWNYAPLWYHILFLLLLIPMTVLGGKFRKS
ncbi:MAG TPA: hypothetical protein VF599_08340 [Pyrinomonadaceae bacterium]|jgi:uncharacterized membrane protein YagU involved in acid resistance